MKRSHAIQAPPDGRKKAVDKGPIKRPQGLLRLLFRLPVWLYRLGLGWLLGQRFLLINHVGRRSGRRYRTVVEVARRDPASDTYIVASGYGRQADWYRNLAQQPEVTVQVGRRVLPVRAELLPPDESGREMADYARRHPTAARRLLQLIGHDFRGLEPDYQQVGRELIPFVAFRLRHGARPMARARDAAGSLGTFLGLAFLLSRLVEALMAWKARASAARR